MTSYRISIRIAALLGLCLSGCQASHAIRDPEYAEVASRMARAVYCPEQSFEAMMPVVEELAGPHPLEHYISVALGQNPDIQAAYKRIEAMAHRVPQAASLPDPMLGATLFPEPVQTAAGEQKLRLSGSQKFLWFGKLNARASMAEAETNIARAQLAAVELEVVEQVKRAYYELYFLQQATRITERDRGFLQDVIRTAKVRYRNNQASQQDVLRAELEAFSVDNDLIRLQQFERSGQARLARLLHISADTKVGAMERLSEKPFLHNLKRLYAMAIAQRPELHAQLAAIQRDRQAVDLARLQYYPDVTASVTWIDTARSGLSGVANGRDAFLAGLSVNLPIYRRRLDAGVREAEARTVVSARQYDSLRDRTEEDVKDLFVKAESQQELLVLFRDDIIPKADHTLRVSFPAYKGGEIDFLQLVDNWRRLLRYRIALRRLESQLHQTLASLERVVGGPMPSRPVMEELVLPPHGVIPSPQKKSFPAPAPP